MNWPTTVTTTIDTRSWPTTITTTEQYYSAKSTAADAPHQPITGGAPSTVVVRLLERHPAPCLPPPEPSNRAERRARKKWR